VKPTEKKNSIILLQAIQRPKQQLSFSTKNVLKPILFYNAAVGYQIDTAEKIRYLKENVQSVAHFLFSRISQQ
jgi:hypothetical protein